MRLIDADALVSLEEVKRKGCAYIEEINNAPTVDAEPVMRCKDCKCWTEWSNGTGSCSRFAIDWLGTDADDFCSMGERKDDETD